METDETLPLSYLSQYGYCPRRAGLLMLDRAWAESADTMMGAAEHERVHTQRKERRGNLIQFYEFPVFSVELGLSGFCDCVEATASGNGAKLPEISGKWALYPVEYKHGVMRTEREYELQLCGQAMCLEEKYKVEILEGSLFYIDSHRRQPVALDTKLREETRYTARMLAEMMQSGKVPDPTLSARCKKCSLKEICHPEWSRSAADYCKNLRKQLLEEETLCEN